MGKKKELTIPFDLLKIIIMFVVVVVLLGTIIYLDQRFVLSSKGENTITKELNDILKNTPTETPTETPTLTPSPFPTVFFTPTSAPIPTPTPTPTSKPVPTQNPNKDAICKNEAELGRIKFENEAQNKVRQDFPELFSFEAAKIKYPGMYTSELAPEYNTQLMLNWSNYSAGQVNMIFSGIKNDGQKLYYQLYNECLTR